MTTTDQFEASHKVTARAETIIPLAKKFFPRGIPADTVVWSLGHFQNPDNPESEVNQLMNAGVINSYSQYLNFCTDAVACRRNRRVWGNDGIITYEGTLNGIVKQNLSVRAPSIIIYDSCSTYWVAVHELEELLDILAEKGYNPLIILNVRIKNGRAPVGREKYPSYRSDAHMRDTDYLRFHNRKGYNIYTPHKLWGTCPGGGYDYAGTNGKMYRTLCLYPDTCSVRLGKRALAALKREKVKQAIPFHSKEDVMLEFGLEDYEYRGILASVTKKNNERGI